MAAPNVTAPLSLHGELVVLRNQLALIHDSLQRDATRDAKLARLSRSLGVPFSVLRERLEAFDAPHRRVRAQIIRPGPGLRDALAAAPPLALVPGYLFADMQHVLYGTPQSLKTFTALDLALHIASGRPWLETVPVTQRGVVFFAGEAAASLRVRVAAWCAARRISVVAAAALPFALIDAVPTFGRGDDGLRDATNRILEVTAEFNAPIGLLVFDNMTRLASVAGLSTTDTGEYGRILAGIDALGRMVGAGTLTIYHSPVSDPSRPAGTYQSTANPDVIMKAEREGSALTTLIRVAPPYGKSRSSTPPPDLRLQFKVQDVTAWLKASYEEENLPLPSTLAAALASDLGVAGPGSEQFLDAPTLVSDATQVALRQQFTSLIVENGGVTGVSSTSSSPSNRDIESELQMQVLEALERHPGASQNTLRAAVGGKATSVDQAILQLTSETLVDDKGSKRAHAYQLTEAGRAHLQATRAREGVALTDLRISGNPLQGGE
jgi:DNA-binding MarR family transcriptional regulator